MRLAYLLAAALLALLGGAYAQDPGDESLRLYAVEFVYPQSWIRNILVRAQALFVQNPRGEMRGYGVYLGQGLILTAAHVVSSGGRTQSTVRIANLELPAKPIRVGSFEQVDLALLAVDQAKLPVSLQLRRMPLCRMFPQADEDVIVAIPEGIAHSTIISPQLLPPNLRAKFSTAIKDVATTGNSGSGVFDAYRGCLLGIMSRKIFDRDSGFLGMTKEKDIAKYFVPAVTIANFIPSEYRN
jgi:hypothetical protein